MLLRRAYWRLTMVAATATAAVAVSGCGSGDGTGAFRVADGSCQIHQSALPSTAYTGGVKGDTEAVLAMMGSYTAHGKQPYCDGHSATSVDQSWTRLYVRLGGIPENVASPH